MTIPELIEKLEKATGPDRELDAAIAVKLEGFFVDDDGWYAYIDETFNTVHSGNGKFLLVKKYTASIDAAVQLCERVLPGWVIDFISQDFMSVPEGYRGLGWTVEIINQVRVQGQSPKPAIALCIAILRALQPKEGE